jgi:hypothetical protein
MRESGYSGRNVLTRVTAITSGKRLFLCTILVDLFRLVQTSYICLNGFGTKKSEVRILSPRFVFSPFHIKSWQAGFSRAGSGWEQALFGFHPRAAQKLVWVKGAQGAATRTARRVLVSQMVVQESTPSGRQADQARHLEPPTWSAIERALLSGKKRTRRPLASVILPMGRRRSWAYAPGSRRGIWKPCRV